MLNWGCGRRWLCGHFNHQTISIRRAHRVELSPCETNWLLSSNRLSNLLSHNQLDVFFTTSLISFPAVLLSLPVGQLCLKSALLILLLSHQPFWVLCDGTAFKKLYRDAIWNFVSALICKMMCSKLSCRIRFVSVGIRSYVERTRVVLIPFSKAYSMLSFLLLRSPLHSSSLGCSASRFRHSCLLYIPQLIGYQSNNVKVICLFVHYVLQTHY